MFARGYRQCNTANATVAVAPITKYLPDGHADTSTVDSCDDVRSTVAIVTPSTLTILI